MAEIGEGNKFDVAGFNQLVSLRSGIFEYGTREQIIESTNMIASALDSAPTLESKSHIGRIAAKMMGGAQRIDKHSLAVQAARELAAYILKDYGLDFNELIGPWMNYKFESSNLGVVPQNVEAIIILESLKPKLNIARTLYQEFGIGLFHRYPSEVLIEQFDKRNDQGASYAVLASCIVDHNQALASIGFLRFVKSLHQNLQKIGYTLRLFEDGSEEEIKQNGQQINERYGTKSSPLILIAGHGEPNSIHMNWEHPRHPSRVIRQQSFQDGTGIKFTDFIADGGTVALISCSTGAVGGIAQEISKQGLTVLGPDDVAALGFFRINRKDGNRVEFNVSFQGAKTSRYRNGLLLAA